MNNQTIKIRIITPRQTLFEGEALSVSSTNTKGRFDILAEHANFMTLVENQNIDIRLPDGKNLSYRFSQAIIYNYGNFVSIFAEPLSA